SASSRASGSATGAPSTCSQSKKANDKGSMRALMRSSENVVPTAQSNWQPSGGRSNSRRCARSSGLSIGQLQSVENVPEQALGNNPSVFQLCGAGVAAPKLIGAPGIADPGEVLLQPTLALADERAGSQIFPQGRSVADQGEVPPLVD